MMKMAAIVRVYNEMITGHAQRFFAHWQEWGADELFVLDDHSDDGTAEYARKFTPHVWVREQRYGRNREKENTVFLLDRVNEVGAEYILFMDCDDILSRGAGQRLRDYWLPTMDKQNFSSLVFTSYNLWRKPRWRRVDSMWACEDQFYRLWKNEGLKFDVIEDKQMHAPPAPPQVFRYWTIVPHDDITFLHYAYADLYRLRERFLHYAHLDGKRIGMYARIIDESSLMLERVPDERFPEDLVPGPDQEEYLRTPMDDLHYLSLSVGRACWKDKPIEERTEWWECAERNKRILESNRPGMRMLGDE